MDRAAIEALYRQKGAVVERRCRALLGDNEEARDMVQEVFVRALVHGDAFRGEAAPFSWLYRISTNLCLNRLRDRKSTLPLEDATVALFHGATPEARAEARDVTARLFGALDAKTQEVLVYRFLDGMSQEEIAEVTGWSRKTIGKKLKAIDEHAIAVRSAA